MSSEPGVGTAGGLALRRERRTIPLHALIGRSARNCRADGEDEDVETLAASIDALGQQPLHAPLVCLHPELPDAYEIDDGGRRWKALRLLRDRGRIPSDHPVDCEVLLDGAIADGTAREAALAANVCRRALHPVEEYEAYARLVDDGMAPERIAADFHVTVRQVRQRLRLGRLAPRVRAAWREGRFGAEVAIAFTAGLDPSAQEALLDELATFDPATIRRRLAGDALSANSAEARYVGADAYVAAGGALDENLFEPHALCRDGTLLKRLARKKLMDEGVALIAKVGLGAAMLREDIGDYPAWSELPRELTAVEQRMLDEGTDLAGEVAIGLKAMARRSTPAQMVAATLVLRLEADGPHADVGMVPPRRAEALSSPDMAPQTPPQRRRRARTDATVAVPARPPAAEPQGRAERPLVVAIAAGREAGVVAALREAPHLALVAAVAALLARANRGPIRLATTDRNARVETPPHASFAAAFEALLHESEPVGLRHLAEVVAASVVMGDLDADALALLAAISGTAADAFQEGARAAFDYAGYAAALPRDKLLKVHAACGGRETDARRLTRAKLAEATALRARERGWLPDALALPSPDRRLEAQAALAPDAATEVEGIGAEVAGFLSARTLRSDAARIRASDLYTAYRHWRGSAPHLSLNAFGAAIAAAGIAKHRLPAGVHYLGVALAPQAL